MPDSLPPCASTFGPEIDHIIWFIFWITGAWLIAAEVLLVGFALRFRHRPGRRAAWLPGNTWRSLAWILVPAAGVLVCDLVIEGESSRVWRLVKLESPSHAELVRITGQQFSWKFTHAGPDGKLDTGDDIVAVNELHVPRDKVVRFELQSADVVHCFAVSALRLKQDAVPGRTIPGWFQATREGQYEIVCAELCGTGHTYMAGKLVVESPDAHAAWLAAQKAR